jgi:predicted Fe-Mo cluster-binding NifX family protein
VGSLYRPFDSNYPAELLQILRTEKVRVIICGAISIEPAEMLTSAGFELIPFITGDVSTVLEAFIKGDTLGETFNMPGCGRNICCRGKIRRGHDISFTNQERERGRRRQSPDLAAEQGDSNGSGGRKGITFKK